MNSSFFYVILSVLLVPASLSSQQELRTVEAGPGDGIYTLLKENGVDPVEYFDEFVDLNRDNLRNQNELYQGRAYLIPEKKVVEDGAYPIFGPEYSDVPAKSTALRGAVYYLVSGHGGPDPGATERYAGTLIAEDEYAYDVTLRLGRELISHGATVYIIVRDPDDGIRDERVLAVDRDEVVYPDKQIPLSQLQRLKQRAEAVNALFHKNSGKYQRLIVTHVDSRSRGQNIDVFFYHHEKSSNGKKLAEHIHETFRKNYKRFQPNRKYNGSFSDRSGLYLVRNTLPAMAYIEIGNLKNKRDQRRILEPVNRQALAKWIAEGVISDFESR